MQEITEWDVPNHIYLVSDSKSRLLGYIKSGESEVIMLPVPTSFSTSRRKFKILEKIVDNKPEEK
jgi:hypothetical protein